MESINVLKIYSFVDRLATVVRRILAESDVYPFDAEVWALRGLAVDYELVNPVARNERIEIVQNPHIVGVQSAFGLDVHRKAVQVSRCL